MGFIEPATHMAHHMAALRLLANLTDPVWTTLDPNGPQ